MPTGGQIVVDHLVRQGVRHLFMVPGESVLGILDALHADTTPAPITCRHESGAAMMAEATGKLLGRPGVALVSRGPGAANAVAGVYVAHQDQTPLILLVGLPARTKIGGPPFQALELAGVFGRIAKDVLIATWPGDIEPCLDEAFALATLGRPGPVVVGLPEDVLGGSVSEPAGSEQASSTAAPAARLLTGGPERTAPISPAPSPADLDRVRGFIGRASRPLVIAGAAPWSSDAAADLARFAERFDLPVACAFRRQDRLDNSHHSYAGHLGFTAAPALAENVAAADLVVVLGSCLDVVTTQGFRLLGPRDRKKQSLILIASEGAHPPPPRAPDLALNACPMATVHALANGPGPDIAPPWGVWRRTLRSAYEATLAPPQTAEAGAGAEAAAEVGPGADASAPLAFADAVGALTRTLPRTAILCSGAGAYAATLQRHFVYGSYPAQLAPLSGSMGYGLPAAIAAKLAYPERVVVAVAGDGCLQMSLAELATVAQYDLPIILLVVDNAAYGSILQAQRARVPPRIVGTTLINPDFAALARAYGFSATTINAMSALAPALQSAMSARTPTVLVLDTTG